MMKPGGIKSWGRRRRRGPSGPELPAAPYHHVDFLEGNVTLDGATIASVVEQGSAGGTMAASLLVYRPQIDTVNGLQFANFADVNADGFRNTTIHSTPASAWLFAADNDDVFSLVALFYVEAAQAVSRRYIVSTMATVTVTGAGFVAYVNADGSVSVGATPVGQNVWLGGVATSPVLSEGWHVLISKFGGGEARHYVDDGATPFWTATYTHSGTGGNPTSPLHHGTTSLDGVAGLGRVAIYEHDLSEAVRLETIDAARVMQGFDPVPPALTPGPGDRVFLVGGQSNANARSTLVAPPEPCLIPTGDLVNVSAWDGTRNQWRRVTNPDAGGGLSPSLAGNGIHAQNGTGQWFARFAQLSIANEDVDRLFHIGAGVDGSAIAGLVPGTSAYTAMLAKVAASGATVTDFMFWQGESDIGATKAAHLAHLEALRTGVRGVFGDINIWAVKTDRSVGDMTGVREALQQWADDHADVTLIDVADLTGGAGHDGTHYYYTDGYKTVGERFNTAVFP